MVGQGGLNGKHGKSSGDLGFIDNWNVVPFNWALDGEFRGFEREERFEIHFTDQYQYAVCAQCIYGGKYAKFSDFKPLQPPALQSREQEKATAQRSLSSQGEATRKKGLMKSRIQHEVNKIASRHCSIQTAKDKGFFQMSTEAKTLEVLSQKGLQEKFDAHTTSDTHMHHCLIRTVACPKQGVKMMVQNKRGPIKVVEGIYSDISCDKCNNQKQQTLSQDVPPSNDTKLELRLLSRCLEERPTLENEDNIFNCLFGRVDMYGTYICTSGSNLRQDLSNALKKTEFLERYHIELNPILQQFSLSVNDPHSFPSATKLQAELLAFHDEKEKQVGLLKAELEKPENNEFVKMLNEKKAQRDEVWQKCGKELKSLLQKIEEKFPKGNLVLLETSIIEEYSRFIMSPWQRLGESELELVSLVFSKQIHVFHKNEEREGGESIIIDKTFNPSEDNTEHFILKTEQGTFQRLEVNDQRCKFQMQKASQVLKFQELVTDMKANQQECLQR
jgi:hypothetical protein